MSKVSMISGEVETAKDKLIGYVAECCVRCDRQRVELYESGIKVCEKCDVDQATGEVVEDDYYSNNI